jgi:hypothetical protein
LYIKHLVKRCKISLAHYDCSQITFSDFLVFSDFLTFQKWNFKGSVLAVYIQFSRYRFDFYNHSFHLRVLIHYIIFCFVCQVFFKIFSILSFKLDFVVKISLTQLFYYITSSVICQELFSNSF